MSPTSSPVHQGSPPWRTSALRTTTWTWATSVAQCPGTSRWMRARWDGDGVGWWENLQESPIFDGKNPWVSCRFSLKPIHWGWRWGGVGEAIVLKKGWRCEKKSWRKMCEQNARFFYVLNFWTLNFEHNSRIGSRKKKTTTPYSYISYTLQ